jgi:hypothetical protein
MNLPQCGQIIDFRLICPPQSAQAIIWLLPVGWCVGGALNSTLFM